MKREDVHLGQLVTVTEVTHKDEVGEIVSRPSPRTGDVTVKLEDGTRLRLKLYEIEPR